jgi:hypothetical protein
MAKILLARHIFLAASTVKWTTHDRCLVLSESVSKLYTNFECREEKNYKHIKKILIYKAENFMMEKKFQEKSTYFRRHCKRCASR